jgi:hypothetical protein
MCTGYDVYNHYQSLKQHFTSKYDYFKYHGKLKNHSVDSYIKRRDRDFFEAVARKVKDKEVVPFLVANIMNNDTVWIGDLIADFDGAYAVFLDWKKRMVNLYKTYEEDLDNICDFVEEKKLALPSLFKYNCSNYPVVFRFMVERIIEKETFIILDDIIGFVAKADKHLAGDIVWDDQIIRLKNYKPFIYYDEQKCKDITKSKFKKIAIHAN